MIQKDAFIVLKYSLRTARVRLLDGRRDCAANRQLELHKRSQLFLPVHNETLSVIAIRFCDQDRSPHRPETTSLSARWLVDDFS